MDNVQTETIGSMQFDIVRNVTLPFLIIPTDGTPSYLKFDTAIAPDTTTFSERVRKGKTNDDGSKQSVEPMHIATVTNLQTGEVARLVVHSVLESNLLEAYPEDGYVGKYFKIVKQKSAKRYFTFNIVEIKLKGQDAGKTTGAKK